MVPLQKDELAELKRLLLSDEQSQIAKIIHRLDDPEERAREIARILPDVVSLRGGKDGRMIHALMPTVEEILKTSVKRDPKTMVDCLFPVMGPAIRRSVAEFVRGMLQSMNQALQHSFSLQGLKWRLESLRTGMPFAEIVLLHSLVFRVEQVFLIHKETGLLLLHSTSEFAVFQDAHMVSGMLTAIQDFVRDSFEASQEEDLENMQMGELTVFVEQGPLAYLAGVIRGNPPAEVRTVFKEALEAIHLEFAWQLESFEGDAAPFAAATDQLEQCFLDRYASEKKKTFPYATVLLIVILAIVGYWVWVEVRAGRIWKDYLEALSGSKGIVVISADKHGGKYSVSGLRDPLAEDPDKLVKAGGLDPAAVSGRWEPFQAMDPEFVMTRVREALNPPRTVDLSLKNGVLTAKGTAPDQWIADARKLVKLVPGISEYRDQELEIDYGMLLSRLTRTLDPPKSVTLSFDNGVLTARGAAPKQWIADTRRMVRLIPGIEGYRDKDLRIDYRPMLERIKKRLDPPDTVTLKIKDGRLHAKGRAPHQWIVNARRAVLGFPELEDYSEEDLKDTDQERFDALRSEIDSFRLYFSRNTEELTPGQEDAISELTKRLIALQKLAATLGKSLYIEVKGHTDSMGTETKNRSLSGERAKKVVSMLTNEGVRWMRFFFKGVGNSEPRTGETSEQERALNRRITFTVEVLNRDAESRKR